MYGPTAISHIYVGRSVVHGAAIVFLWVMSMALSFMVVADRLANGPLVSWIVPILLSTLAGVVAWRIWARSKHGTLAWDGETWSWSDEHARSIISLQMTMDLGEWVLVRIVSHATGRSEWLLLERAQQPTSWADLRRALVFSKNMASHRADADAISHVATVPADR